MNRMLELARRIARDLWPADPSARNHLIVTGGYRAFTVTDGAIRMPAVRVATALALPAGVGKMKSKPKFTQVFSKTPAINRLSAARFFLFGSRDV